MTHGELAVAGALFWLVIVIAYGFYRVGLSMGRKRVSLVKQGVVKIVAECACSDLIPQRTQGDLEIIYRNLAHNLLQKIAGHIRFKKYEDDSRGGTMYRGELFVGTKDLNE